MLARLTADELAKDVAGAEALIVRHKENKAEIDTRVKEITRFTQRGNALIAEKNFLASEVSCTSQLTDQLFPVLFIRFCVLLFLFPMIN
jgi:spectrin beta